MRDLTAELVEKLDSKNATACYRVLYDGQCEICQACVAWLKTLDADNKTICLPITADALTEVDSRLKMEDCLRQLHVVTPAGNLDRKSTRLNSSHVATSYAVFCLKKKQTLSSYRT